MMLHARAFVLTPKVANVHIFVLVRFFAIDFFSCLILDIFYLFFFFRMNLSQLPDSGTNAQKIQSFLPFISQQLKKSIKVPKYSLNDTCLSSRE